MPLRKERILLLLSELPFVRIAQHTSYRMPYNNTLHLVEARPNPALKARILPKDQLCAAPVSGDGCCVSAQRR